MKRDSALTVGLIPRPLGRKTGGAGDLFPRIRYAFKEKASIPRIHGGDSLLDLFGNLKFPNKSIVHERSCSRIIALTGVLIFYILFRLVPVSFNTRRAYGQTRNGCH